MTMVSVNVAAALIIFFWSTWCVVYDGVRDGVVGKLLYACTAMAALGVISFLLTGQESAQPKGTMLNLCMAGLALRHFFLRVYWPRLRCRLFGRLAPQRRESDGL